MKMKGHAIRMLLLVLVGIAILSISCSSDSKQYYLALSSETVKELFREHIERQIPYGVNGALQMYDGPAIDLLSLPDAAKMVSLGQGRWQTTAPLKDFLADAVGSIGGTTTAIWEMRQHPDAPWASFKFMPVNPHAEYLEDVLAPSRWVREPRSGITRSSGPGYGERTQPTTTESFIERKEKRLEFIDMASYALYLRIALATANENDPDEKAELETWASETLERLRKQGIVGPNFEVKPLARGQ